VDPPVCKCNTGYRGGACTLKECLGQYFPCTGRGTCDTTQDPPVCTCQTGFSGVGCEEPPLVTTTGGSGTLPPVTTTGTSSTGNVSGATSVSVELVMTIFAIFGFTIMFAIRQ
jgi:hypothetical protein